MKGLTAAVLVSLLTLQIRAAEQPAGVVEMFDFGGNFGRLTRAESGVPRAKPHPAQQALDRWRASAATFTHGFAVSRGGTGTESFSARRVYEDDIGQAHVRMSQTIAGLPVVGAELIVHADLATGDVLGVNGRFAIDRGLQRAPRIAAGDAIAAALREYGLAHARVEGVPELTYIVKDDDIVRLAWTNTVSYFSEDGRELDQIYADALTGAAIARLPLVHRAKNREVYDCLTGDVWNNCVFLFGEGGSSADVAAMAAYDNAGIVYDYFSSQHGRDGMDGKGIVYRQAVHYGTSYDNAGWINTFTAVAYGDGNTMFSPMSFSLDIVGHEFTHGVIWHTLKLLDGVERSSINEGLADVFAVAIDAYRDGSADWMIAEDVYTPGTGGDALRYLYDPARQSDHTDFYPTRANDGHKNAGIVGLAFYLFAKGGVHPRREGVLTLPVVTAQGLDKAERAFYRTIAAYLTSNVNFRRLRDSTMRAASDLYGQQTGSQMGKAWTNVGNEWQLHDSAVPTGGEWIGPSYTTRARGIHTAHFIGLGGLKLHFEKRGTSGWTRLASNEALSSVKEVEINVAAGEYRWRLAGTTTSGTFTLHTNRPD